MDKTVVIIASSQPSGPVTANLGSSTGRIRTSKHLSGYRQISRSHSNTAHAASAKVAEMFDLAADGQVFIERNPLIDLIRNPCPQTVCNA